MSTANIVIKDAIQAGAPVFNDGDHGKCADIYTHAASQLLSNADLAHQLDATALQLLAVALRASAPDATERAWQLRSAFDIQLASARTVANPAAQQEAHLSHDSQNVAQVPAAVPERRHYVRGSPLCPPFPAGCQVCAFGAGCFWGAEKGFWRLPGVYTTAVGYCGGREGGAEPRYEDVCSGTTGHNEVTRVVWDPQVISFADLLRQFWRCHNPTQGNRQGNDQGTQYRSGIYCSDELQASVALASLMAFEKALCQQGFRAITTEVRVGVPFHYAEDYHQQFLAKPGSRQYCSAEPTGVPLPAFDAWLFGGASGACTSLRPKLPELFWSTFDSSVSAPNEPVEISTAALVHAASQAQAAMEAHAALLASAEREHVVIVSYCGGCGFAKRAKDFAQQLRGSIGVEVGLVKDVGITGNFDVKVRQPDSTFHVVHSKKAGDGFVDSANKLQRIICAIQIASGPGDLPARPTSVAADSAVQRIRVA